MKKGWIESVHGHKFRIKDISTQPAPEFGHYITATIVIYEEYNNKYFIDCKTCKGTGQESKQVSNAMKGKPDELITVYRKCPVCKGLGYAPTEEGIELAQAMARFLAPIREQLEANMSTKKCTECGEETHLDICQECCEHGDLEDLQCLDCGKDCTEDLMTRAYDLYKERKYED